MDLTFLFFLGALSNILEHILIPGFLFLSLFGIVYIRITDNYECSNVLKNLKHLKYISSIQDTNNRPQGIVLTTRGVLKVDTSGGEDSNTTIILITLARWKHHFFRDVTDTNIITGPTDKRMEFKRILFSTGIWGDPRIIRSRISPDLKPTKEQDEIIQEIKADLTRRSRTSGVYFIDGPPGTGKTDLAFFLTLNTNGTLCSHFDPTLPNHDIIKIYDWADPSETNPLIIVINEPEGLFNKLLEGIPPHKNYVQSVRCRNDWNTLLDNIDRPYIYPNTILLITSNTPYDKLIKDLCKEKDGRKECDIEGSMLRKGRIHKHFQLTKVISLRDGSARG